MNNARIAQIAGVGRAFPEHYYPQAALSEALKKHWAKRHFNLDRLDQLHQNVLVDGRHLALTLEEYEAIDSFTAANDAFIRVAVGVGSRAIENALEASGLGIGDVSHLVFVSTTGIATPSVDARIVNRIGLRSDIKRTPLFGLGCVAGAVGITRASDYLRAFPGRGGRAPFRRALQPHAPAPGPVDPEHHRDRSFRRRRRRRRRSSARTGKPRDPGSSRADRSSIATRSG